MPDAVVIGSGPNGLTGAIELARNGMDVLVLEAKGRPGGAVYSIENTLPGFLHDVGAAFFPFAEASPALCSLKLDEFGLQWLAADFETAHPAPDGTCAAISRDIDQSVKSFGRDGDAWRRFQQWQQRMGRRLPEALLATLPALGGGLRLGMTNGFHLGMAGMSNAAAYARRHFTTEAAQRIFSCLGASCRSRPQGFFQRGVGVGVGVAVGGRRVSGSKRWGQGHN